MKWNVFIIYVFIHFMFQIRAFLKPKFSFTPATNIVAQILPNNNVGQPCGQCHTLGTTIFIQGLFSKKVNKSKH